jgi:5'(3')-deoxyribonucleotidase
MRKIFVDMDGVLADFDRRWFELFGSHTKDSFNKSYWEHFVKSKQFSNLDPFPGMETLVRYLKEVEQYPGVSVMILGSTGGYELHGTVQEQKLKWMKEWEIPFSAIFVPGKRFKQHHATSQSMLIDDHPKNIEQFLGSGGAGHLYLEPVPAIEAIRQFLR